MESKDQRESSSEWIARTIKAFVENSPENSLKNDIGDNAWGEPLVGFSRGDDPFYETLKNDIGPFYWTPIEIIKKTFPDLEVSRDQLSVISWVLPQTEKTKSDHRKEPTYPSERWARSRLFGEDFNNKLRQYVVETLNASGMEAVAPMQSPFFERKDSEKYGFASTWSERHTAFVCGLGTFGLSDGLITPVGKAIRCGSVVARVSLDPTPRPYTNHQAYCLFYSNGICKECIDRCPVEAISEEGHDKVKCRDYLRKVTAPYVENQFGLKIHACGLCQTGISCESGIPLKEDV